MTKTLVDTNLIVRFIVDNDKKLEEISEKYILWIPLTVFFETVYVLQSVYHIDRKTITSTLLSLASHNFVETEKDVLTQTLSYFVLYPSLGLVDSYLLTLSQKNSVKISTYDQGLYKKSKVIN